MHQNQASHARARWGIWLGCNDLRVQFERMRLPEPMAGSLPRWDEPTVAKSNWIDVPPAEHARRDVRHVAVPEAAMAPLVEKFAFEEYPKCWGAEFRFELFKNNESDMLLIARTRQADVDSLHFL